MTRSSMLRTLKTITILAALLGPLWAGPIPAAAQSPCGTVDAIDYPLDPARFHPVYAFGVASSRYDGRYHAGEDWFGGRASTYGTPVQAIARGRVTYSAPLGWGLDKGVVILEHLMPDGTWWYSLYGHMEALEGYPFPAVFTCVEQGAIIGAIGRPRPAPHLHLETRDFGSDSPGPGYWGTDPIYSGWQDPSKFIRNWQAWLNPAHAWHADMTDVSGPLYPAIIRADHATIVFDDNRLKALNPVGQVLWRYIMADTLTVVGVMPSADGILVADYGGIMQRWSLEGGFIEQWQLPSDTNTTAFTWLNLLIIHNATTQELIAYGPDRAERWRVPDVQRPVATAMTNQLLGIASIRGGLAIIGPDGRVYDRQTLPGTALLAPAPEGGLYARTENGLWRVDASGTWQALAATPPVQRASSAFSSLPDGRFFLYTGQTGRTLHAYDATGALLWQTALAGARGRSFLLAEGGALVLADGQGTITVLNPASGAVCAELTTWGARAAGAWAGLGPDGILRVHLADQVLGLHFAALTSSCGN
jgi:murein DD-endopeptidase MepM/ murein hydrolase activator NlpD